MIIKERITKTVIHKIIQKHKLGNLSIVTQLTDGFANFAFLVNKTYVIRFNAGNKIAIQKNFMIAS